MVCCVVLNWNNWQDTLACLRSLQHQTAQSLEVLVIDNGSSNDSVERIAEFLQQSTGPTRFRLIEHGVNDGFARGSNVGIRKALANGADYVWLLNNDTECPADTLEKLLRTAEFAPDVGIVGTVLYYHHDPLTVQAWGGGRTSRWLGTAKHFYAPAPMSRPGTYVTFASALIRADVFRETGLLYDGAFMYYEDSDFCLRLEKTRWKLAVAADTSVLHKESASTDGDRDPAMERATAVAGLRFLRRHSPLPWFSVLAFLVLKLVNRARLGKWTAFRAVWQAGRTYRTSDR